jgi:hypothetical protein
MITVEKGPKQEHGHCQGCHKLSVQEVYVISADGGGGGVTTSLRLCADCSGELLRRLAVERWLGISRIRKGMHQ